VKFKQVYQQKHALEQERIKYSQELDKIEEKLQIAEREKRECEGMVQLATRKSVDLETEKQCLMEKNRDLAKLCEDTKAQCEEFVSKNDELLVKLTSSKESYEGLELKFKQVYQQKRALEQERIKYHQELDEIEERLQIAEQEKEEYKRMLQAATEEVRFLFHF
jgi:chromosome segregation ATPase